MPQHTKNILVIDDNARSRSSLQKLLADLFCEFKIYTAASGAEGVEIAKTCNPDVILLDILMPVMDGFEVCKILKENKHLCNIPVVFIISRKENKKNKVLALKSGADGFLTKPYDKSELLVQINSMIKIKTANDSKKSLKKPEQLLVERTNELQSKLQPNREKSDKLNISEDRFRTAQDMSPDGFTILHPLRNKNGDIIDFTWIYENQSVARINGTNPKEIIGKRLLKLFPGHKGTSIFEAYLLAANTGKTQILEEVYAGEILSVPTWLRIVVESIGEDIAIIAQNITEQKQTKEALQKSEDKYRTLFDQSIEGIYIHDLAGRILDVNDMACRQSGYSREELLGLTVFDGHSGNNTNMNRKEILNAWNKWEPGQRFMLEGEHRRKDGTIYPVEISTGIVSYENKNAVLAIVKDITERKKTNDTLQKIEYNYKEIFNSTNEAIFIYDAETNTILDVNESACLMFGFSREELLSLTLKDFSPGVPPFSTDDAKQWLEKLFKEGKQTFEWLSRRKSGEIFWMEISLKIVKINGLSRILTVIRDITDRKNVEVALKDSHEVLSLFIKYSPIYAFLKEVTSDKSRVLFASENYLDMIGIPGSQMKDKEMDELFPPEFARKISKDDWDVVTSGKVLKIDETLNNRNYTTIKFPINIGEKYLLAGYTIDITDLKKSEHELIREKERAEINERRLIEAQAVTKVGSWETDLLTLKVFWSEETFKIFELNSSIFSPDHNSFLDFVHPDDREKVDEVFNNSFKSEEFNKIEHRIITTNGNTKYIEERWRIIKDNIGTPIKAYGTCQDITDRKNIEIELFKAKEKAEENESKLIAAQEIAKLGSWELDINTGIFTFTDSFYNIFHTSAEEMGGYQMSVADYAKLFVYPDDASKVAEETQLAIESSDPYFTKYLEHRILYKDGGIGYISVKIFVIKDEFGNTIKTYGVNQDISEKKMNEIELVKAKEKAEISQKKFKAIADTSPLAIYISKGIRQVAEYINPAFYNLFGYKYEEVSEVALWWPLAYPDFEYQKQVSEEWNRKVEKAIINKSDIEPMEVVVTCKDGSKKNILWGLVSTGDENWAFGMDLTAYRKAEKELIAAKEKAEESDRLKSAFLANMSHEIRTPMNGILGFTQLLKEPDLTGNEQQEYIELINKSGKRMLNIINDIIDISKIEAGLMKTNYTQSNVAEQIEYIHTFFKPEAEIKGLKLSVKNYLTRSEANIITDREKLYAILTNLVKNAVKFTPKGEIEIGCLHKGSFIEFYVKDTGIGIPKDRRYAIFERFIQADLEDSMAHQGAGLGLSISKAYLDMLGGKIWVESEEGKGSTFYFTLPYITEVENENTENILSETVNKTNIRKLKILLVEDDEVSEILIYKLVNSISKNILKAKSGFEAVKLVRENPDIDLILMDIQLPEIGGYEVVRQIRQFNKDVVIIAQTAYGLTSDKEKAISAGCNDYITKPINKDELLNLIHKYFTN